MKLALVIASIAVIAGAFFLGYRSGANKQKVVYQTKIIQSGERHANVEKRQSDIISSRDNYDLSKRLHEGSF